LPLSKAAKLELISTQVQVSCSCKGTCSNRRCWCIKEKKQYSIHCYRDERDCGNLVALPVYTEITLQDRTVAEGSKKGKYHQADTAGANIPVLS